MPELPDVETYRRYLESTALRQRIERIHTVARELLHETSPQGISRALTRHRFERTRRHGKYLLVSVRPRTWLVLHFGMTGYLRYYTRQAERPAHTCLDVCFANGHHLAYVAPRKLGRIALIEDPDAFVREQALGPDALAADFETFRDRLAGGGRVKTVLMRQEVLAGIGNVYSDEILFHARLHPTRSVRDLSDSEWRRLHRHTHRVLEKTIACHADPERLPRSFLLRHRRQGERCPRCRSPLRHQRLGGRTAWFCARCQR